MRAKRHVEAQARPATLCRMKPVLDAGRNASVVIRGGGIKIFGRAVGPRGDHLRPVRALASLFKI